MLGGNVQSASVTCLQYAIASFRASLNFPAETESTNFFAVRPIAGGHGDAVGSLSPRLQSSMNCNSARRDRSNVCCSIMVLS